MARQSKKNIPDLRIDEIFALHEKIYFEVPRNVSTDINSYNYFSKLSEKTLSYYNQTLAFDFFECEFFDVNAFSIFGAIVFDLIQRGNTVEFCNQSPDLDEVFTENKFYSTVFNDKENDWVSYKSLMPCLSFEKNNSNEFVSYIDNGLLSFAGLPEMTKQLKKKINERLLEIFSNAHEHGKATKFYSSGEFSEIKRRISITLCNMGRTIKNNVNAYLKRNYSAVEALEWAVKEGNTTREGNIPGGLGISLLREFLSHNEGYLEIISSNGYWQETGGQILTQTLNFPFSGTIVNIVINIDDKNSYMLASEAN